MNKSLVTDILQRSILLFTTAGGLTTQAISDLFNYQNLHQAKKKNTVTTVVFLWYLTLPLKPLYRRTW